MVFKFIKNNNRESRSEVVVIELKNKNDFLKIEKLLRRRKFKYQYLNNNSDLFTYLVS